MLNIQKILFPVALAENSPHVAQQVRWLARRFNAEVILLHVMTPFIYPAGLLESGHEITPQDFQAHVVQQAEGELDQVLRPEIDGLVATRLLLRGNPANEIVRTAREHNADLIVMPTHGYDSFYRFLVGSVTAKVLHECSCPVWTGAHLEDGPPRKFEIRHVLCSVDLSPHSEHTASFAAGLAVAVEAKLTLVHVTSSVEFFGPGGPQVDSVWKDRVVGYASSEISKLQESIGTRADVVIDSGRVPELLNAVAARTKADVLVIGHKPHRSHLGDNSNGYGIIRESRIPVLSV